MNDALRAELGEAIDIVTDFLEYDVWTEGYEEVEAAVKRLNGAWMRAKLKQQNGDQK